MSGLPAASGHRGDTLSLGRAVVCPVLLVSQRLSSGGATSAPGGGTHLICVKEGGIGCESLALWTGTLRGSDNLDARLTISSREQSHRMAGKKYKQIVCFLIVTVNMQLKNRTSGM